MEPVRIPRRVDDPPHMLLWSGDEIAPILLGLVFGVFTGLTLYTLTLGVLTTNIYRRFRENHADGYLLHMIYWAGFMPSTAPSFKHPYVRRYIP